MRFVVTAVVILLASALSDMLACQPALAAEGRRGERRRSLKLKRPGDSDGSPSAFERRSRPLASPSDKVTDSDDRLRVAP